MFESLSDRFDGILSRLRGKGRLTESDIAEAMREIRLALLEADVHFNVVQRFIDRVQVRCLEAEVTQSLTPGQQVVKVVNEELTVILGGESLQLSYAQNPPTVVLMAGLQGSGKTTSSAKLARWFKSQGRNPLLVGADLQRPAAVEQLRTLAERVEVPVFSAPGSPVDTAQAGLVEARRTGRDVLIVDTAGRLTIDRDLMDEIAAISDAVDPNYTFLVVDAMTGQDAVNTAEAFHTTLELDGIVLTKLDGDARGGAALSVKEVVGKPIAFASTGEKLDDFDQFHPERMAERILGMGDVLTLIEKAEEVFEKEVAEAATQRLLEGTFTLDDFVDQLRQVRRMGDLSSIVSMMPGVPKEMKDADIDEREIDKVEAIALSMTSEERINPDIIDSSRRTRIANGSGTTPAQVGNLLKQFKEMRKMMKGMAGMGTKPKGRKDKGKKSKKGKKGPGRTGGGRVQSKEIQQVPNANIDGLDLTLPGR
ncbi:MAG: signal recognition particle protein [Actinomycetota bacterium]|uniref:signal-recognition-particle GTPase n=1 Tax=marine metagenome TaxID=408172 RepID=A0A381QNC2_9ZZZZ|nr:signal recognition particle protein [Acidimicrobiales bacterium]MEC8921747.1 signal recognition particle protein [Actinomycetota bacterium]MEE2680521.1 signal recognition particle protein [Actinomycetota bacterium]|tara:strand:+ start:8351 stop:9790 length:1440 start_codon:yes stop_codon:yes gene_type:complete